ncbi:hypothetical protein ALC60_04753 [Trachymyrmex zeteki]|uniref:Uncharacterized protein n=2 Tax=Mycetomoellerius zeteki TaxID=64791 RepID=A0A151X7J8_9HYME|nr:hypothetical protein ALC60_04753 [Trachymyrmex zeteki]
MFTNKKNNLPARPHMPNHEHMLEDLDKAVVDDIAFKIANECMKESYSSTSVNNTDDIYKQVKTYLSTKQQLKQLECVLKKESQQMHADNEEIKRLADDIRKQAKAALIT